MKDGKLDTATVIDSGGTTRSSTGRLRDQRGDQVTTKNTEPNTASNKRKGNKVDEMSTTNGKEGTAYKHTQTRTAKETSGNVPIAVPAIPAEKQHETVPGLSLLKQNEEQAVVIDIDKPIPQTEIFSTLYGLNVNPYTEKKNGLTYLSWAWAWAIVKSRYDDANYRIHLFGDKQLPYVYDEDTGYMVFTTVTIGGTAHTMWLPVMDGQNRAMKSKPYKIQTKAKEITVDPATMFDINKTIMRCLVKNLGMFGVGSYIYAGEDLPAPELPTLGDTPEQQPQAQTEADALKTEISALLSKLSGAMSKEDKLRFAETHILPAVGAINFNVCQDLDKLKALKTSLSRLNDGGKPN